MHTIEVALKHTPAGLSVQRKSAEEAEALYQKILGLLGSSEASAIELECDRHPGKKMAVLSTEIAAVQIYDKASMGATGGRTPGFFALEESTSS
jgi:hypothetical protein